jgi:hypothetical protein
MSKRIATHLRRNVYGLLALFFALSGTAIALDGQNTVFTDDITNGEVKSVDILKLNPPGDDNGVNFNQVHVSAVALSGT